MLLLLSIVVPLLILILTGVFFIVIELDFTLMVIPVGIRNPVSLVLIFILFVWLVPKMMIIVLSIGIVIIIILITNVIMVLFVTDLSLFHVNLYQMILWSYSYSVV